MATCTSHNVSRARSRSRRTLHLVDVENLHGDPRSATDATVAAVLAIYRQVSGFGPHDQAILGVNPRLWMSAKLAWPGANVRPGYGPDGADHAILASAEPDWITGRFCTVVIASGDHIFCELAVRLRRNGVHVAVVARRDATARSLRLLAETAIEFPAPGTPVAA